VIRTLKKIQQQQQQQQRATTKLFLYIFRAVETLHIFLTKVLLQRKSLL